MRESSNPARLVLGASLLLAAAFAAASHATAAATQDTPSLWDNMTSAVIVGPASGSERVRALKWTDRSEIVGAFPGERGDLQCHGPVQQRQRHGHDHARVARRRGDSQRRGRYVGSGVRL